jgi:hypothetical protein
MLTSVPHSVLSAGARLECEIRGRPLGREIVIGEKGQPVNELTKGRHVSREVMERLWLARYGSAY